MPTLSLIAACLFLAGPAPRVLSGLESPPPAYWLALELHGSMVSDVLTRRKDTTGAGLGLRAGWRPERFGVFFLAEGAFWRNQYADRRAVESAVNIGPGVDLVFREGFVRVALAAGVSVLTRDNPIDDAGSTGVFLDARVGGFRWALGERSAILLDPLAFQVMMPVLSGIPMVEIRYRTVLGLELGL